MYAKSVKKTKNFAKQMTKDSCCHLTELMVNCQFDATLCIFYIVHFVRENPGASPVVGLLINTVILEGTNCRLETG